MATTAHATVNMLAVEGMRATASAASALGRPATEIATYTSRVTQ